MSSAEYIIKCSIVPPGVVYIKENSVTNEFAIEFEKVPVKYATTYLQNWDKGTLYMEESTAGAVIYIRISLGEGVHDLCTAEQASNLTFTTVTGEGWNMAWSSSYQCFLITPPANFKFPDSYRASFRSSGFYTSAMEGTTILEAYFSNFIDVVTKITAVDLYKRYPIYIEYFSTSKDKVEVGQKITLSWRVLNAQKCYITGIGQVETEGSREITINEPGEYELSVENDMGMTERKALRIGCIKPTIKIWADRKYYHKGDTVTVYWESTSADAVQITPYPGQVSVAGQMAFIPEATKYMAIASGYDGFKPFSAIAELQFEITPWQKKGQISGVELTLDALNSDHRIWDYKGNSYLFCNRILYKSSDLLTWEKESELVLAPDLTLQTYGTTVTGAAFLVVGITKKNSTFIWSASYDFTGKTWTMKEVISDLNNIGGKMTSMGGSPYYGILNKPLLMFFTSGKNQTENWDMPLYYKNKTIDTYDIASLRGNLYASVHDTANGQIVVNRIGLDDNDWIHIGSTDKMVDGWFAMIATIGVVYLLTKDWMINLENFLAVSPYQPPLDDAYLPWTGSMKNQPFVITKDGSLWYYEI